MKLATHLIMTLSLLLIISIRASATREFSSSSLEAVVDIDGDEVKTGEEYYMFSTAGSFSLGSTGCNPCPLDVVIESSDESSEVSLGLPLTFLPMNHHKPGSVVRVSTDLNIKFNTTSIKSTCTDAESAVWSLEHNRWINRSIITAGGRVNGWFKFEKVFQFLYKIHVPCPDSRDLCAPCGELAYPAAELNSLQRRLFVSSSAPSTTEYIFYVGIAKANFTLGLNNLMMNINGIRSLANNHLLL